MKKLLSLIKKAGLADYDLGRKVGVEKRLRIDGITPAMKLKMAA